MIVGFASSYIMALFIFVWMIVGFKVVQEIPEKGVNHKQCGDVMLSWLILQIIPEFGGWLGLCIPNKVMSKFAYSEESV